jgi:hypothetical protein
VWTDEAFAERLRGKTAVFVGVGAIADYAKRRLMELREGFPDLDVWVVSPGIVDHWEDSQWASLFPDLPPERRIARSADEFLDQLSRRWVRALLDSLDRVASAGMRTEVAAALTRIIDALGARGAPALIRWARFSAIGHRIGRSVVRCPQLEELLIALAVVLEREGPGAPVVGRTQGGVVVGARRLEVLIACRPESAERVRAVARRRAEELAGQGTINDIASFVVAGMVVGSLENDPDRDLDMAVGELESEDVVVGASAVRLEFTRAAELAKAA